MGGREEALFVAQRDNRIQPGGPPQRVGIDGMLTVGRDTDGSRAADAVLTEAADLVTEMTLVKHHFAAGVKAQAGIEF